MPQKIAASNKSRDWWSLKQPLRPELPGVADTNWPKTPIDNFILAKLTQAKLKPSSPADKRTLVRRATYDLIGLPPTQAEIDAFVNDPAPSAFEKVVDRLLASPQYGVRWGDATGWMLRATPTHPMVRIVSLFRTPIGIG